MALESVIAWEPGMYFPGSFFELLITISSCGLDLLLQILPLVIYYEFVPYTPDVDNFNAGVGDEFLA
ncbi:hypothetical protein GCM10009122_04350 [Fulvivirga kasyanovii]